MPGIFYQPVGRRSFLKTFSAAALAFSAGRVFAQNGEVYHAALFSDTHIAADIANAHRGFTPSENLKTAVAEALAASPDGAIINGDAARLEGLAGDYEVLKTLLAPLAEKTPVCIGLGNHDDRDIFAKAFASPSSAAPQKVPNKHVLVIETGPARLVILDSLMFPNKTPGFLGNAQRAWLKDYLQGAGDKPILLFVHHTLGENDGELLDAERLFSIITPSRNVKAVFYGHSHVYSYKERDGVHLVNLPAVGYNFRDTEPVGWVDAYFTREGAKLTLKAIGGDRKDHDKTATLQWRS